MGRTSRSALRRCEGLVCLVSAATALAALAGPAVAQEAVVAAAAQRRPGPPLEVNTLDGKSLKIQRMKGKVVLLDFMTTVCPTCKAASAGLQSLYQELGPKGFFPVVVALNVNTPGELKLYALEHGLTFAVGITAREGVGSYLNHPADKPLRVPTLVLLDRSGRVCSIEVGWKGADAIRASVLKLLGEAR